MDRSTVADVITGAHRAVADLQGARDQHPLTAASWDTTGDEPVYLAVCADLGYPVWDRGEPFPHRIAVGELDAAARLHMDAPATLALTLRVVADEGEQVAS